MTHDATGVARAALVLAFRNGWSESERRDLTEARAEVTEILDAYHGEVPKDLLDVYADEFDQVAP